MDPWMAVSVLSRWLHVGTAIVLLGGSVYLRYVLMPAAADLPEAEHQRLQQRLMGRWRKFVMAGIGLLLLSGGYNYLAVAIPTHKGQGGYHAFLGTKILLALVVFFLASALVGRAKIFETIRENRRKWLAVIIALAAVIVGISGFVKVVFPPQAPPSSPAEALESAPIVPGAIVPGD